jgi:hypothetical protein
MDIPAAQLNNTVLPSWALFCYIITPGFKLINRKKLLKSLLQEKNQMTSTLYVY